MKDNEYEKKRHKLVLERISNASNIKELPNISLATLTQYLVDNAYLDNRHLNSKDFKVFINKLFNNDNVIDYELKECFIKILKDNYPNHTDNEYEELFDKVLGTDRLNNMFDEIEVKKDKIKFIQEETAKEKHFMIMDGIKHAVKIDELNAIERFDLDELIKKATKNEYVDEIGKDLLENYIQAIYNNDENLINNEIKNICTYYNDQFEDETDFDNMVSEISNNTYLEANNIIYALDEANAYEKRVHAIYLSEHLKALESVNAALNLSQLPKNLNEYKLCKYLAIHSNSKDLNRKFKTEDFKELADLLLKGEKIDSDASKDCLRKIIKDGNFVDTRRKRDNLIKDLISKYTSLPRLEYFVEEINLCRQRQQEFTTEEYIDVELFAVPTHNLTGGNHFTLFKMSNANLNVDELIKTCSSLDELEEKGQKKDPAFKKIGGFIIRANEKINMVGSNNIKFYRHEDGKQLISTSRKEKMRELLEAQQQLEEVLAQDKAQYEEKVKITSSQLKEIKEEIQKLASSEEDVVEKKKNLKNES